MSRTSFPAATFVPCCSQAYPHASQAERAPSGIGPRPGDRSGRGL